MDGIWLFVRTLLALVVVVALAAVSARALARLQKPRGPASLEVLGVVPLGGRRSLAVVRVGQRAVVVGVGEREVSCLDVIEDPLEVAAVAGEAWQTLDEARQAAEASPERRPAGARPVPLPRGRITPELARALWAEPVSGRARRGGAHA